MSGLILNFIKSNKSRKLFYGAIEVNKNDTTLGINYRRYFYVNMNLEYSIA